MNLVYPPGQDGTTAKQSKGSPTMLNSGKGTDTIIWQNTNPNEDTSCRLTLVDGNSWILTSKGKDKSRKVVLKSLNKEVDAEGNFKCGQQSEPEFIQIKELPSDFQCSECQLEFTWKDPTGEHTSSSEVKLYGAPEDKENSNTGGSSVPYLLAAAASVGGGILAYKALAPKNDTVKEKEVPKAKPKEEDKVITEENKPLQEPLLRKPEDDIVTEHAPSRPPRRQEPEPEPEPVQKEEEEPELELRPEPIDEPIKEELKTPIKEKPLVEESNQSPALVNTPDLKTMEGIFMDSIQKIIESNQIEEAQDFREPAKSGRFSWKRTHFVFVIDCSGSMRGTRWDSVKFGLKTCLNRLKNMEEIRVSGFTFDDEVRDFCREVLPKEAIKLSEDMVFSAKGTDYIAALEHAMTIIEEAEHKDYLACIMFLSDGLGGLPEDTIEKIREMKRKGSKILFYTIACATEDDDDLKLMSTYLSGEHYMVTNPEASKIVFTKILAV